MSLMAVLLRLKEAAQLSIDCPPAWLIHPTNKSGKANAYVAQRDDAPAMGYRPFVIMCGLYFFKVTGVLDPVDGLRICGPQDSTIHD